jgi:hypothetical protein
MAFNSDLTGNPGMFTTTLGQGLYSTENGQNAIAGLNITTEPVGTLFPATPFITFDVDASRTPLLINFIYPGGEPSCAPLLAATPTPGQICTPPNVGGSPFVFLNQPPPTGPQSTASFVIGGVVSGSPNEQWIGTFSANFNVPLQTVLSAFAPGGSGQVQDSYNGTITVFTTPEPGPLVMMGIGLGLLAFWKVGAGARKRQRDV